MSDRKFYKTTYTVVVLSEDKPASNIDLENLARDINTGDCVGEVSDDGGVEISGKEAADSLYAMRSEPAFFELDDEGNKAD